jgi:hypothetical protein
VIVTPPVVTAFETIIFQDTEMQRNLAMGAAILQRIHRPLPRADQHNGIARKSDRREFSSLQLAGAGHGIPEIRVYPGFAQIAHGSSVAPGCAYGCVFRLHDSVVTTLAICNVSYPLPSREKNGTQTKEIISRSWSHIATTNPRQMGGARPACRRRENIQTFTPILT